MSISVTGFGRTDANGTYTETGTVNGYPLYIKGDFFCVYKEKNGPYSFEGAYYISETIQNTGSAPIVKYLYINHVTDITTGTWASLLSQSSGENATGTVV